MARPRRRSAYKFAAEINEWYEAYASPIGGALRFLQQVVLDLLGEFVDRTPVSTGRAKGNWQVSTGQPITYPLRRLDPQGAVTLRAGLLVLQSMTRVESVWITNNVPYALKLERGHSAKAPYGMLALGLEAIGQRYGVAGAGLAQFVESGRIRGRQMRRAA